MGTRTRPSVTDTDYPRRSGKVEHEDGAPVVVRARESRAQGEGGQGVDRHPESEQRPVDSDQQALAWLLNVQRKLYQWSKASPNETYRDLWNWVTSPHNLRCAWRRVASNKDARTAGVDGKTVRNIRRDQGEDA